MSWINHIRYRKNNYQLHKTLIDIREDYGLKIEDTKLKEQYDNYKYGFQK